MENVITMKKIIEFVLASSLLLTWISLTSHNPVIDKLSRADKKKGESLLVEKCYPCHGPSNESGKRLAPPMEKVHAHYFSKGISREEFAAKIKKWVENPHETNAVMHGAVRNFGVMPKVELTQEEASLIANYLYTYDKTKPGKKARKNNNGKACCDKCSHH